MFRGRGGVESIGGHKFGLSACIITQNQAKQQETCDVDAHSGSHHHGYRIQQAQQRLKHEIYTITVKEKLCII